MSDVTSSTPLNTPKTPPTWQLKISTMRAHIWQVSYVIWVLKLILADLPADLPSTPQMHHGIYIMGCIWQPFWILQEKVVISCYFCIIRVVNSQLAWYSHVRCNPLDTPNTHETPPKHPHMTITNFNYEGSYLPGVICNIVVKADLGRSGRCTLHPPNASWHIYDGIDLAAILDSSRKGGNFLLFLHN